MRYNVCQEICISRHLISHHSNTINRTSFTQRAIRNPNKTLHQTLNTEEAVGTAYPINGHIKTDNISKTKFKIKG